MSHFRLTPHPHATTSPQGNAHFTSGSYLPAIKSYKTIFLYLNGLHGSDSQMKSFMSAMGASSRWDSSDSNNKVTSADLEGEIRDLKGAANSNIAMCYLKMEKWEKALRFAKECLKAGPNLKASYRAGKALLELQVRGGYFSPFFSTNPKPWGRGVACLSLT